MREVEVPPLSAPIERFRLEVSARATRLARRRRTVGGSVAAGLLVALAVFLTAVAPGASDAHRSAVGPNTTIGGRPAGPFGLARPDVTRPRTNAPALAQRTTGGTASDTVQIVDPPTGATSSVKVGREATVVLPAPPTGHWGNALVTRGKGSVLSVVHQASDPTGGVRVTVEARAVGVADLQVPRIGHLAGSWHGTIAVTGRLSTPG